MITIFYSEQPQLYIIATHQTASVQPPIHLKIMVLPMSNKAAVHEAVCTIIAPMTINKIMGHSSNSTVSLLKQQIAKITTAVKTMSWDGCHRHLALVLNYTEYFSVTNITMHMTFHLELPPIMPPTLETTQLSQIVHKSLSRRTRIRCHNGAWPKYSI